MYKKFEIENGQLYRKALDKFRTIWMELTTKSLKQIAFITRPKWEERMLIGLDKSTNEEHLSQPLQLSIRQFKIAVTFLTGCIGFFWQFRQKW